MKQRAFTLIEIMIVVAILGILAAIAMYSFKKKANDAKAAEVPGMFAEIKRAELSFQAENGYYLSTSSSETNVYPALLSSGEPKKKVWQPSNSSAWARLGVTPPDLHLYCGYAAIAGSAGTLPSGTYGKLAFKNKTPQNQWFYVIAICDLDGDSTVNTTYVSPFDREVTITKNDGQ